MKTIKDVFPKLPKNEDDLVAVSDEMWKLDGLDELKEQVSPELFITHISMNMIGIWQGDGWQSIVADQPQLLAYIPQALTALRLSDMENALQNLLALFPGFVVFDAGADHLYCDVMNFFINTDFKVKDERLNQYSKEERTQLSQAFHNRIEVLDNLSEPLWGYGAPVDGWGSVLDYIKENHSGGTKRG